LSRKEEKVLVVISLQFTLHVWLINIIILKVKIVVPSREFA
jgi:hypothetical protein